MSNYSTSYCISANFTDLPFRIGVAPASERIHVTVPSPPQARMATSWSFIFAAAFSNPSLHWMDKLLGSTAFRMGLFLWLLSSNH